MWERVTGSLALPFRGRGVFARSPPAEPLRSPRARRRQARVFLLPFGRVLLSTRSLRESWPPRSGPTIVIQSKEVTITALPGGVGVIAGVSGRACVTMSPGTTRTTIHSRRCHGASPLSGRGSSGCWTSTPAQFGALSVCAGNGRDVLGALALRPDVADVNVTMLRNRTRCSRREPGSRPAELRPRVRGRRAGRGCRRSSLPTPEPCQPTSYCLWDLGRHQ